MNKQNTKKTFWMLLLFAIGMFSGVESMAQLKSHSNEIIHSNAESAKLPRARVTDTRLVMISPTSDLSEKYQGDISHLRYESIESAIKFFDGFSDELVKITIPEKSKMILGLSLSAPAAEGWNQKEWNEYLSSKQLKVTKTDVLNK